MNKEQALQELDEKIAQEQDIVNDEVGGSPAYSSCFVSTKHLTRVLHFVVAHSRAAGKIAAYNQAKKLLRRVEE